MITLEVPASQSHQELRDLSQKLKMLSDPTRLGIMILLAKGESNVGDICKAFKIAQPTASHHLGLLRMNGFIMNLRKGKNAVIQLPE